MVEKVAVMNYSGGKRQKQIEEEEKRLQELLEKERGANQEEEVDAPEEEAVAEEGSEDEGPEPTTAEEKVWKKRHGDLRRHTQKQINELTKQVDLLKTQLEQKETNPNLSEEKLEEVAQKNPVVIALIEKKAKEIAEGMMGETREKFESLTQREEELLKEKNENQIRKQHTDYDSIVSSDEFHEWAGSQDWLQDIVYSDDYYKKPEAIVNILNLYKMNNGMTPVAKKQTQKDAMSAVKTKGSTEPVGSEGESKMRESYFQSREFSKLSVKQQEEVMEKWNDAVRKGNVIFDLSGK